MNLKDFAIVNRELDFPGIGTVMALALSMAKAKEEQQHVHDISCGNNDINLYRRL